MDKKKKLLLCKEVDWPIINDGIILPPELNHVFGQTKVGKMLEESKVKTVRIILDGRVYYAQVVTTTSGDKGKADTGLKLSYSKNSPLANKFKSLFKHSYDSYMSKRKRREKDELFTDLTKKEYLCLYSTKYLDTFYAEAILANNADDFIFTHDDGIYKSFGYSGDIVRVLHTIGSNKYYRANWKALVLKFHDAWKAHQNCILLNHNSKFIWGNEVELNLDEKIGDVFGLSIENKEFIREIEEEDLIQLIWLDKLDFSDFKKLVSTLFTKSIEKAERKAIKDEITSLDATASHYIHEESKKIIENIQKELNAFKDLTSQYSERMVELINRISTQEAEINDLKETIKELNEKKKAQEELRSIKEELIEVKNLLKSYEKV